MLLANIDQPETYRGFLNNPIWGQALDWIRHLPPHQTHGIYEIRGQDIYANLHGYATLPREQCRYESHRRYVDLQYCIRGGESIEWRLASELRRAGEYDLNKDVMYYDLPANAGAVLNMTPGTFAVFFPEDAHLPKLANSQDSQVEKVVVKILVAALV